MSPAAARRRDRRSRRRAAWAFFLLLAAPASVVVAAAEEAAEAEIPGPSFRQVLGLRSVSSPRISPDGLSVAYQLGTVEWEENRYDSEIWVARTGQEPFALTATADGSSNSARWSPDGRWLAFLAARDDEGRQLHVIRPDGGEARRLSEHEGGVSAFRWSPDGARIAFTATDERSEGLEKREKTYGEFAVEDHDLLPTHLWLLDVDLADPFAEPTKERRLTDGDERTVGSFEWSPDGRSIAFDHRPRGYISAFLTTTTDRFRAISDGAGISDWMTYYVNTDIHGFTRQYLQATPWDDPEIYAKTSPMSYIKGAVTPTLIQHGEFDRRVPVPNAYQLYQGLQDQGVDTRLIIYKGFGHGISKPKERLAAVWHNWQWFAKYLWGEEVELPLAEDDENDTSTEDEPTVESAGREGSHSDG